MAIAFGSAAVLIRYVKVSVMEQERQDYVKTAQSKGVPSKKILRGHVLRNSLIPVLTIFGMTITDVLGGSIIIENVFSLPGIGRLISSSINSRDLPLIQGAIIVVDGEIHGWLEFCGIHDCGPVQFRGGRAVLGHRPPHPVEVKGGTSLCV